MFFMQNRRKRRFFAVLVMCIFMFTVGTICSFAGNDAPAKEAAPVEAPAQSDTVFTVIYDEEDPEGSAVTYDVSLYEEDKDNNPGIKGATEYVGEYANNLEADKENFEAHTDAAIKKIRETIPTYATFAALLAPIIAIVLALITKEVYSSLVIGIIVGGAIYAGGNFEGTLVHVVQDGFIANVADSYNMGILIFLILLGKMDISFQYTDYSVKIWNTQSLQFPFLFQVFLS